MSRKSVPQRRLANTLWNYWCLCWKITVVVVTDKFRLWREFKIVVRLARERRMQKNKGNNRTYLERREIVIC